MRLEASLASHAAPRRIARRLAACIKLVAHSRFARRLRAALGPRRLLSERRPRSLSSIPELDCMISAGAAFSRRRCSPCTSWRRRCCRSRTTTLPATSSRPPTARPVCVGSSGETAPCAVGLDGIGLRDARPRDPRCLPPATDSSPVRASSGGSPTSHRLTAPIRSAIRALARVIRSCFATGILIRHSPWRCRWLRRFQSSGPCAPRCVAVGVIGTVVFRRRHRRRRPRRPHKRQQAEVRDELDQAAEGVRGGARRYGARLAALEEKLTAMGGASGAGRAAAPPQVAAAPAEVQVPPGAAGGGGPAGRFPVYGNTSALSKIFNPDMAVIGNFLGAAGKNDINPAPGVRAGRSRSDVPGGRRSVRARGLLPGVLARRRRDRGRLSHAHVASRRPAGQGRQAQGAGRQGQHAARRTPCPGSTSR